MIRGQEREPMRVVAGRHHVDEPCRLENHLEAELTEIEVSAFGQLIRHNNWICCLHCMRMSFLSDALGFSSAAELGCARPLVAPNASLYLSDRKPIARSKLTRRGPLIRGRCTLSCYSFNSRATPSVLFSASFHYRRWRRTC